jgi:hypothetical protein
VQHPAAKRGEAVVSLIAYLVVSMVALVAYLTIIKA